MEPDRLEKLELGHQDLREQVEKLKEGSGVSKDLWDKLAALTPLITGIAISGTGLFFAYTTNQAQLKLQETQTIEKLIPHLIGSEQEKKAAIIAMSSLADTKTAAKFAELFPSEGTASALKSIARSANTKSGDRVIATRALAKTFHSLGDAYQSDKSPEKAEEAYHEALIAQEGMLGKNSPELLESLSRLTGLYQAQGNYGLAQNVLTRVMQIQRDAYGSRSRQLVDSLRLMSELYRLDGKPRIAQQFKDQADLLSAHLPVEAQATAAVGGDPSGSAPVEEGGADQQPRADDPGRTVRSAGSSTAGEGVGDQVQGGSQKRGPERMEGGAKEGQADEGDISEVPQFVTGS